MQGSLWTFTVAGLLAFAWTSVATPLDCILQWILRALQLRAPASSPLAPGSLSGKVCIVTGSNTGIGRAAAAGLFSAGGTVVLACRDVRKAEDARSSILREAGFADAHTAASRLIVLPLDLADLRTVGTFVTALRGTLSPIGAKGVSVLINNGGLNTSGRTAQGFEMMYGVNYLSHFLLTMRVLQLNGELAGGSEAAAVPLSIISVSSCAHRWGSVRFADLAKKTDPQSYATSKFCQVLFTLRLRALQAAGAEAMAMPSGARLEAARAMNYYRFHACCVHPGGVLSDIWRTSFPAAVAPAVKAVLRLFFLTPEQGAAPVLAAVSQSVALMRQAESSCSAQVAGSMQRTLAWHQQVPGGVLPFYQQPYLLLLGGRTATRTLLFELLGPFRHSVVGTVSLPPSPESHAERLWALSEQQVSGL